MVAAKLTQLSVSYLGSILLATRQKFSHYRRRRNELEEGRDGTGLALECCVIDTHGGVRGVIYARLRQADARRSSDERHPACDRRGVQRRLTITNVPS